MQRLVLPSIEGILQIGFHIVGPIEAVAEDVSVQLAQGNELLPSVEEPRHDALLLVSLDAHATSILEHQVIRALLGLVDNLFDVVLVKLLVTHERLEVLDLARRLPLLSSHWANEVVVVTQGLLVVLLAPSSERHSLAPAENLSDDSLQKILLSSVLEHLILVLLPGVLQVRAIAEAYRLIDLLSTLRPLVAHDQILGRGERLDVLERILEHLLAHKILKSMVTLRQFLVDLIFSPQSIERFLHLLECEDAFQVVLLRTVLERDTFAEVPFVDDIDLLHASLSLNELTLVNLELPHLFSHISHGVPDVGKTAFLQEAKHSSHVGALHLLDVVLVLLVARSQFEDGSVGTTVNGRE